MNMVSLKLPNGHHSHLTNQWAKTGCMFKAAIVQRLDLLYSKPRDKDDVLDEKIKRLSTLDNIGTDQTHIADALTHRFGVECV